MSETESWTVGRLLTWTTDYLKRQGADSPRLDAEVLLATARSCQRIELYTAFNDLVPDDVRTTFRDLVKRRAGGEPVAYLVGHREFYSLTFEVTSDVLIPRPETEDLVMRVVDLCKERSGDDGPLHIVDVGTGSGAIAISVARQVAHTHWTAIDISPAALDVARRNAARHQVAERIEFVCGDLLAPLPPDARFDLVVSNPPYVSRSEWESLKIDVRQHEPYQALVAGQTGTEVIASSPSIRPSSTRSAAARSGLRAPRCPESLRSAAESPRPLPQTAVGLAAGSYGAGPSTCPSSVRFPKPQSQDVRWRPSTCPSSA
jgi:release factor glutamine methyltransferase